MRTLIGVTGIGLGHATRVHALLPYIKDYKIISSEPAHSYFTSHGIPSTQIKGIDYKGTEFALSLVKTVIEETRMMGSLKKSYDDIKKVIENYNPDVIVSDSEPLTLLAGKKLKKRVIVTTNVPTIPSEINYIPTKYLKSKRIQRATIRGIMRYLTKNNFEIVCPTFIKYHNKNVKFINPILRPITTKPTEKNFYIVNFGGSDFGRVLSENVLPYLHEFPKKKFILVSNKKQETKVINKNVTVVPFIKNMIHYVQSSRGIISHAGHISLSETLCLKKPSLVIPLKNHLEQLSNANSVYRKGLAYSDFDYDFRKSLTEFFEKEDAILRNVQDENIQPTGAQEFSEILK